MTRLQAKALRHVFYTFTIRKAFAMALTYVEDRTGVLAANKITGEIHTITAENNRNFHLFLPKFAPFYEEGFKLFKNINGTQLPLDVDKDFFFVYKFEGASLSTSKNVFGGICFMDMTQEGEFEIEYQTVGGPWVVDQQQALEIIANEVYNPRGRTWDQVMNYPTNFGPTEHIQDEADFMSSQQVGEKLDAVAEAIAGNANRPLPTPPVTLEDLGIPKIGNWGMATVLQAVEGKSNDTLISPLTLAAVLEEKGINRAATDMEDFRKHIANKNNPHGNNKETVDLGKAQNIGKAADEKILTNQDDEAYVTLTQMRSYLRIHGCKTAPEDAPKFPEKGTVLNYRCTSNFDRMGIFADGFGHSFEQIVEPNSPTCGYRPPEKNNFPPHGTVLQYYCLDFDRWKIVADGYGGSYHAFVLANSGDCGYDGGSVTTKPPAGTLLSAYCDGTILVQTLANGNGGSYENRIPGHTQCADNVKCPPADTLVSTSCENKNEIGKYTNGSCGYYTKVIAQNSTKCGYAEVTTKSPITNPPHGTPMGSTCRGQNYVNMFADGNNGTYDEIVEYNSSRCGYISTTTTTTTTRAPVQKPNLQYSTSMGYMTPNTTMKERHTVTMSNGRANAQYSLIYYIRSSSGQVSPTYFAKLQCNAMGQGTQMVEVGVYGKDPNSAFVPDDTYQCWVEATDDGINTGIIKSNIVPRTFAGFGQTPAGNMSIDYSIQPNYITIGSYVYHTISVTGARANSDFVLEIQVYPTTPGYKTVTTYTTRVRSDGNGRISHSISPAMQGMPNGMTGPSAIIPDSGYKNYVVIEGVKSNEVQTTWATGSPLRLDDSIFKR